MLNSRMKLTKTFVLIITSFFTIKSMGQIYTADQLSFATINLRKEISQGKEEIGTGSFIKNETDLYILTASHVAVIMDKNANVVISDANSKPIVFKLSDITDSVGWVYHPVADMAILKLKISEIQMKMYFQRRFIALDMISRDKIAVPRNIQLTIIGFPLGLGAAEYFSPLTFRTFSSSTLITMNRADTHTPQTFIILENPSIGGYSGGAVYDLDIYDQGGIKISGSKTMMRGIIHGTISDDTGGKLAAVTPSFYLFDMIK
jgi:S1-C subfamily serine protease